MWFVQPQQQEARESLGLPPSTLPTLHGNLSPGCTHTQAYHEVPLTLVLGLTTSADTLLELLPSEITDRCLALHHFKLVRGWAMIGLQAVLPGLHHS